MAAFNSTLDQNKKKPLEGRPPAAFGAGQALRGAGAVINATAGGVMDAVKRPGQIVAGALGDAARGFFGAPASPATPSLPIPTAQAAPAVKPPSMTLFDASNPSNFNVRPPSANAAPARNPVSNLQHGGAPAGGVPAPVLKPGDVNTFTGADGVTRAVPLTATPAAGSVQAQSFGGPVGGLPLPQNTGIGTAAPAASPAPTVTPTLGVPRPVQASIGQVGAYGVQNADAGTGKIASTLEDAAFRAGLRASRGSRSAADSQAQILGTLAQLGGQRLGVAAGLAGGDRDATAATDRTGLSETGANQRAALADTGLTSREGMQNLSAERIAQIAAQAKLNEPTQITDESGNLLRVTGTTASPVIGADGRLVRPQVTRAEGALTPAVILDSLTKQLAAEAGSLQPDPNRMAELRQRIATMTTGGAIAARTRPGPPKNMEEFMARAKAVNPNASDAELRAYYAKTYGT